MVFPKQSACSYALEVAYVMATETYNNSGTITMSASRTTAFPFTVGSQMYEHSKTPTSRHQRTISAHVSRFLA